MRTIDDDTKMIGRTKEGDPVWRRWRERPFLIVNKGQEIQPMGPLWWWPWPPRFRRLPEPHLSYGQVATANEKGRKILRALRQGPIYLEKGFLKSRSGQLLCSKVISKVVLHWLEGCGVALYRVKLKDGRTKIDIDVEATEKNNVR